MDRQTNRQTDIDRQLWDIRSRRQLGFVQKETELAKTQPLEGLSGGVLTFKLESHGLESASKKALYSDIRQVVEALTSLRKTAETT